MEVYRIINSTDKMAAHFIFNVLKLECCKINESSRKAVKLPVYRMFKMAKIYTGSRKDRRGLWK